MNKIIKMIVIKLFGYKEIDFRVAGVTFKNGSKTRQAIIRAIKYKDEPFDSKCCITFERYFYENELAISVLANGQQIGNVPRNLIEEFDQKWTSDYIIEEYEVLGTGREVPFGFRIKVLFNK